MSCRWKEQSIPITSLSCLNIAIKEIGQWKDEPQELRVRNANLEKLKAATTTEERVSALTEAVFLLRNQVQAGHLPQSLSVVIDGQVLLLSLQNNRYTISGVDNSAQHSKARAGLAKLNIAYTEAVASLHRQLQSAEEKLKAAEGDAASVKEFELERDRLQNERTAMEAAQDELKKTRIEKIKQKAKTLGYTIREIKVGNAVQLNLVRRV